MIVSLDSWIGRQTGLDTPVDPQQLYRWQLAALRQQAQYAADFSVFYHHLYQGADFCHPETLPLLSAAALQQESNHFVCVAQSDIKKAIALTSSGTMDKPKRIYFSAEDLARTRDFFAVGFAAMFRPRDTVLVCMNGDGEDNLAGMIAQALAENGAFPYVLGEFADSKPAAAIARAMQPQGIIGLPRQILALCRTAPELTPDTVLLSGENVPDGLRQELAACWRCRVLAHWGMRETGLGGALECLPGAGYHLRHADLLVQIIDPATGELLPPGAEGEIVVSTLNRRAMPLLRYRTGDISRLLEGECPGCGSRLPRLAAIGGHLV